MTTDMRRDIRRLVRLQEIAFQVKDLADAEGGLPERIGEVERAFRQKVEDIGAARLRHETLVQQEQKLDREREETEQRLRVAQQKLMQVSNQREYSAVLMEIDTLKSGLASLDARLLQCQEEIEQLAGPAAEADAQVEAERARVDAEERRLADEIAASSSRLADLRHQRDEIASELPQDVLRRFESIARARGGVAVARIERESCGACHVRLRPQVLNLARRGEELVTCDSCRRILFIDENDDTAADPGVGIVSR